MLSAVAPPLSPPLLVSPPRPDPPTTIPQGKLLSTRAASELLGVATGTLAAWRRQRIGPNWVQYNAKGPDHGKCFYFESELYRFIAVSMRFTDRTWIGTGGVSLARTARAAIAREPKLINSPSLQPVLQQQLREREEYFNRHPKPATFKAHLLSVRAEHRPGARPLRALPAPPDSP
jgi:hypothetical protein